MQLHVTDTHDQTLDFWRASGGKGLTCVHVDASLDCSAEEWTPQLLSGITPSGDLTPLRGQPQLRWAGLHCGNYLTPAMADGTLSRLIWVLPGAADSAELAVEDVLAQVMKTVDLSFADYRAFVLKDGRVEGKIHNLPFLACTADSLPEFDAAELAINVDLSYFEQASAQTPGALFERLPRQPRLLSVATSVSAGDAEPSDERLAALLEAAGAPVTPMPDPLVPEPLSRAARAWRQGQAESCLQALEGAPANHPATWMLRLQAQDKLGRGVEAQASCAELLSLSLTDWDRSRALVWQADFESRRHRWTETLEILARAYALDPNRPDLCVQQARICKQLGRFADSARWLRKAQRFSQGRFSSLPIQLELARVYAESGQLGMAQSAQRYLQQQDPVGNFAMKSILDASFAS